MHLWAHLNYIGACTDYRQTQGQQNYVAHCYFTLLSCQLLNSTIYPPTYFPIHRGVDSTKIDFSTIYPPTYWKIRGGVDDTRTKVDMITM